MPVIDSEAVNHRLDEATATVSAERRKLTAERDAFTAFAARVADLDITESSRPRQVSDVQIQSTPTAHATIRTAYEKTVMAVPHFDTDYAESYEESVRAELGPDIASALVGEVSLGEPHRDALVAAIETAVEKRQRLLDALADEADSLVAATDLPEIADEVASIEQADREALSQSVLDAHLARLDVLEKKCTQSLDDRQAVLVEQRRSLALAIHDPDIPTYLYRDLPVQYPVVASTTTLLDCIDTLRTTLRQELESPSRESPRA